MFLVADDFAAIARRLKEIEAEVAKERAAEAQRLDAGDESEPRYAYEDMAACA